MIYDYYEDAVVSMKTGNHKPEFDRMIEKITALINEVKYIIFKRYL